MSVAVTGFAHVNLNCADLSRSKPFYEQALGLRALVHTDPAPQDCSAFGLSEPGQWDAWMLGHTEPGAGCALDLLEWRRPQPLAANDASPGRLGLRALGFELPDLASAAKRVTAAGGRAAGVAEPGVFAGADPAPVRAAWDPDGAPLWLREAPRPRMAFVEIGVSQLERSLRFYCEVFGLEALSAPKPHELPGRAAGLLGPLAWQSAALALPADASGFRIALTAWQRPASHGRALAEPHRLGLFRMAFVSPDVSRAHAELRGLGVPGLSAVADLDLGPSCPAPRCRALFFRDPDGACLELIEVPSAAA